MTEKEKMIEFLKEHDACKDGFKWALEECSSLQEIWDKAEPEWLVWLATREGVLKDRDLHQFALFCANFVKHLIKAEWLRKNCKLNFNL